MSDEPCNGMLRELQVLHGILIDAVLSSLSSVELFSGFCSCVTRLGNGTGEDNPRLRTEGRRIPEELVWHLCRSVPPTDSLCDM